MKSNAASNTLLLLMMTAGASYDKSSHDYCKALNALTDNTRPSYLAVISKQRDEKAWYENLPMPRVVYTYSSADVSPYVVPSTRGAPVAAFFLFVWQHHACLPRWALFLHSGSYHPLRPEESSALLDGGITFSSSQHIFDAAPPPKSS